MGRDNGPIALVLENTFDQVTRVSIRWSRSLQAPRDHRLPANFQGATRLPVQ